MDIHHIHNTDREYPPLLREIPGSLDVLYCVGSKRVLRMPLIAVVGTRHPTIRGRHVAQHIATGLVRAGFGVVSGLARGIDGVAHTAALYAEGRTVAVLAHGLNILYPPEHSNLSQAIIGRGGSLVSEYTVGTSIEPHQFLARNRIISGLAQAVVIVEAPQRSGTLSTARHALDQGREVYVVPGPAHDKNYTGSHFLIREGARLVTSATDIIEDLSYG